MTAAFTEHDRKTVAPQCIPTWEGPCARAGFATGSAGRLLVRDDRGGCHRSTTTASAGCEQQIRMFPSAGRSRGSGS
jgi:hypothetical protein